MSHPTNPIVPEAPARPSGSRYELHKRGRAFGFEYDLDLRILTLSDPEMEPSISPLLPEVRRLVLPGTASSTVDPAPDGIGRWESEGGAVT